jgi:hypothetical protein
MEEVKKKSKTQLLRELQDTVDKFFEKKRLVESVLDEIDELEKKYHFLRNEIKK